MLNQTMTVIYLTLLAFALVASNSDFKIKAFFLPLLKAHSQSAVIFLPKFNVKIFKIKVYPAF